MDNFDKIKREMAKKRSKAGTLKTENEGSELKNLEKIKKTLAKDISKESTEKSERYIQKTANENSVKDYKSEMIDSMQHYEFKTKNPVKPKDLPLDEQNNIIKENNVDKSLQEKKDQKSLSMDLVTFKINDIEYALPVSYVKEIIRIPYMIKPPNAQKEIIGICYLRGDILPIIDTEMLFNGTLSEQKENSRVIVLDNNKQRVGLLSDKVSEVISITYDDIKEVPSNIGRIERIYLDGIVIKDNGKRVIILLNIEGILKPGRYETDAADQIYDIAKTESTKQQDTEEDQILLFSMDSVEYGISISHVNEIIRLPKLINSPYAPSYVEGVFAIRNKVIPLINLGKYLNINEHKPNETDKVIILNLEGTLIGFLVENVSRIIAVKKEFIFDNTQKEGFSKYIKEFVSAGNDKRLIQVLDIYKMKDLWEYKEIINDLKTDYNQRDTENKNEFEHIVIFKLDNQEYGVNIGYVNEIRRINEITRLPKAPYFIDGMIDLREEILPIINLKKMFDMQGVYTHIENKIVVAEYENRKVGILIDGTSGIMKLPKNNIEDAPIIQNDSKYKNYIYKVAKFNNNDRNIIILNFPEILSLI